MVLRGGHSLEKIATIEVKKLNNKEWLVQVT